MQKAVPSGHRKLGLAEAHLLTYGSRPTLMKKSASLFESKKTNLKPNEVGSSWRGRVMELRRKNSRSYETAVLEQSEINSDVVESGGLEPSTFRV